MTYCRCNHQKKAHKAGRCSECEGCPRFRKMPHYLGARRSKAAKAAYMQKLYQRPEYKAKKRAWDKSIRDTPEYKARHGQE
jgi:hypothetical protein